MTQPSIHDPISEADAPNVFFWNSRLRPRPQARRVHRSFEIDMSELRKLRDLKMTLTECAKHFGVGRQTILNRLKEAGL